MKPALGHVTCGLGGDRRWRAAVGGDRRWLALLVVVAMVVGDIFARRAMLGLVVEVVFEFFLLVGGLLEWRLNWLVDMGGGVWWLCVFWCGGRCRVRGQR